MLKVRRELVGLPAMMPIGPADSTGLRGRFDK
jgi:hypothetical protein